MPRMRADLPDGKLGECWYNKSEFMRVSNPTFYSVIYYLDLVFNMYVLCLLGMGEMARTNYQIRLQFILASVQSPSN